MYKRGRCNEACWAVACSVRVFYMPCRQCFYTFCDNLRMEYSYAHCRQIKPQALRSRPPSPPPPPSPLPRYEPSSSLHLSFLPNLPPPYEFLSDAPPSFHLLMVNGKMFVLEPGGKDAKWPVDEELCLPLRWNFFASGRVSELASFCACFWVSLNCVGVLNLSDL